MAIRKIENRPPGITPIEIDLTGPDGNAYVLLSIASRLCQKLGYDKDKASLILDEMRLTDYEGLLYTFDREFGLLVTLWR